MNQEMNTNPTTPVVAPQENVAPTVTPIEQAPTVQPVQEKPKKKHTGCIIALVIVAVILVLLFIGGKILINKVKDFIDTDTVETTDNSGTSTNTGAIENTVVEGSSNLVKVIFIGDKNSGKNDVMLGLSNNNNGELDKKTAIECVESKERGITLGYAITNIKSNEREYQLIGNCNNEAAKKGMIVGAYQADAAVLVVSATDGPTTQTREQLSVANQTGVAQLVVFLNNTESVSDKSLLDLNEEEIKDLITEYGYDKNTTIIRGDSKKKDTIQELVKALDSKIKSPQTLEERKVLVSIEDVFTISGKGTVVTGRVETGTIKKGDGVEIIGPKGVRKTTVSGIEMFRKEMDYATAGDNVGVELYDLAREDVERGDIIVTPNTVKPVTKFEAIIYTLTKEEGGRHTPFYNNYLPQFYFRTSDVSGTITLPNGTEMVMPGDITNITVELKSTIGMEKGTQFSIREGGRTIGAGMVTKVIS